MDGVSDTLPIPEHRRYYVVFSQGLRHWLDRFLKPNYGHCYLLIWDTAIWICVHPTYQITRVTIDGLYGDTHPAEWPEHADCEVVQCGLEMPPGMRTPWWFGPLTCVELIKSFLGIRSFLVWTPWQLARYLRARADARSRDYG